MEIVLISSAFLLSLLGCVFVFLPGIPGPLVAWAGPLVYFAFTEDPQIPFLGIGTLVFSGIFAVLTLIFDFFSSWWGAAKFGATWRGGLGAFIGAIIGPIVFSPLGGIFGMLLGLLVGPIIGAVLGEFLGGSDFRKSTKAGWGTLLGALAAMAVKLFYCLAVLVWMICIVLCNDIDKAL